MLGCYIDYGFDGTDKSDFMFLMILEKAISSLDTLGQSIFSVLMIWCKPE